MKLLASHRHLDGTETRIALDTDGEITDANLRQDVARSWRMIREEALHTLRHGRETDGARVYTVLYATGGRLHELSSLAALAHVTRKERALYEVEWPEDPRVRS